MMQIAETKAVPNSEMLEILVRLAREDEGVSDPTTLPPALARKVADNVNRRWNQNLQS